MSDRASAGPTTTSLGPPASGERLGALPDRRMTADEAVGLGMNEPLYEALRTVRFALAKERDVPAYVIAPDRTLMELALFQPRSRDQLRLAHGMGPARITAYGEALFAVVEEHRR